MLLNADLQVVRPDDTDPETYAEIEIMRLEAAGRHDEAEELRAAHPRLDQVDWILRASEEGA